MKLRNRHYSLAHLSIPKDPTEKMTAVKTYLGGREDIAFAYLFGSRAAGTATPLSDVDIAVFLTQGPYAEKRLKILGDLIDILRDDRVDLVILNQSPLPLKCRIVRTRVVLADSLPFVRHLFESRTIRSCMDFSKIEIRILERRYLRG